MMCVQRSEGMERGSMCWLHTVMMETRFQTMDVQAIVKKKPAGSVQVVHLRPLILEQKYAGMALGSIQC